MSSSTLSNIPASLRVESERILGEKYKVARLIGEGGMGAVYEAENTWTRRRVAIKVMRPEYANDPESTQRFLREAQSAAQIDHPNVVSVLDLGRDAATGSLFIVQEFLDGRELRALLDERGALPPEEAMELLLPVLDGLVGAHALGVVHRDLKPENIFLVQSRTGRVVPKIIDFGIAKALRPRQNEFRTMIGQTIGTPGYMSPEQARGDIDIDARTDVWAMGIVLYEALAGRIPYDDDGNVQVMLAHVITLDPHPLERFVPGLAPELRAVVARALQRDRALRYPDMQSFYDALAATALGRRVSDTLRTHQSVAAGAGVTSASQAPTAAAVTLGPAVSPPDAPSTTRPRSRGRWIAAAIVGVLLLVALVAEISLREVPTAAPTPTAIPTVRPAPVARPTPVLQRTPAAVPEPATAPGVVAPVVAPVAAAADAPEAPERRGRRPRRHGNAQRGANGAAIID